MKTAMKVILTGIGIAVLASPVMAQTWWNARVPLSTDNALWGLAYEPPYVAPAYGAPAYGSVARLPSGRLAPGFTVVAPPRILDCVHVTFPQCSGAGN